MRNFMCLPKGVQIGEIPFTVHEVYTSLPDTCPFMTNAMFNFRVLILWKTLEPFGCIKISWTFNLFCTHISSLAKLEKLVWFVFESRVE